MNIHNNIGCFLIICFFILGCSSSSISFNKTLVNDLPRTVQIINDSNEVIRFELAKYTDNERKHKNRNYYSYSGDSITIIKGGTVGRTLHGIYEIKYSNGSLKEKGYFKDGLKQGKWRSWFVKGSLKSITHYHNGRALGKCVYYNDDGSVSNRTFFLFKNIL